MVHQIASALPPVEEIEIAADGITLSARHAAPEGSPHGTLVALHGGGARAAYWDNPLDPAGSLVRVGAHLGWRVLAVDRPGYGASAGLERSRQGVDAQARTIGAALDALDGPLGDGVLVVGHSLGAIVGLRMVAHRVREDLIGYAAAGFPLQYTDRQARLMAQIGTDGPYLTRPEGGEKFGTPDDWFGPPGTWHAGLRDLSWDLLTRCPTEEFLAARDAPAETAAYAARVEVPVHWTASEHEATSADSATQLEIAARLFARAPALELHLHPAVGHNISLHHGALGYHLRVLAFGEDCRQRRAVAAGGELRSA